MATQGASVQSHRASDTADLVREHSHAFQNTLNTTQTDSQTTVETVNTAKEAPETNNELPIEATKPAEIAPTSNLVTETKPQTDGPAPAESSAIGSIPSANDSNVSVGPKNESAVGEKRDLDSTLGSDPVSTESKEEQDPIPSDEREAKKQKTVQKPATASNGTEAEARSTDKGPKKAGRSKKEKITDAVNKVLPGEGIGSRTRSRTKGA